MLAVGGSQPLTSAASHSLPSRLLQDAFQAPAAALLSSGALSAQPCAAISQDDHARTSMAPKGEQLQLGAPPGAAPPPLALLFSGCCASFWLPMSAVRLAATLCRSMFAASRILQPRLPAASRAPHPTTVASCNPAACSHAADYDADYEKPNKLDMGAIEEVPLQQVRCT